MAGILQSLFGFKGRMSIGDITVDASISEDHSIEGDSTDHPVEEGADISDHYRARPRQFQADCIITNTPISTDFPGATVVNSVTNLAQGAEPVEEAWGKLKGYVDDSTLVNINTSLETYSDIMLTSVKAQRTSRTGQSLRFTVTGKQLRKVFVSTTSAISGLEGTNVAKNAKTTTAQSSTSKGKKPTKDASPEKSKSMGAKLLDGGKSLFK